LVSDCIFCRIAAHELPSSVVFEDQDTLAIDDLNPVAPVHVLVIPRLHTKSARELEDQRLLGALLHAAHEVARLKGVDESGYRLIFNVGDDGGQTVHHTHLHVLGGRRLGWPPG